MIYPHSMKKPKYPQAEYRSRAEVIEAQVRRRMNTIRQRKFARVAA